MYEVFSSRGINGECEYCYEDRTWYGTLIGTHWPISFYGDTLKEAEEDFYEVVDRFLERAFDDFGNPISEEEYIAKQEKERHKECLRLARPVLYDIAITIHLKT